MPLQDVLCNSACYFAAVPGDRPPQRGRTIATLLRRSWRAEPEPREEPADLAGLDDILIPSGTAPLAWHVLRSESDAGRRLHDIWRVSHLEAVRNRRSAAAAVAFFRGRGIEPLLIKGFAIARLYPEAALRPHTDTDLAVGEAQWERARQLLADVPPECGAVDLHGMPEEWRDRRWEELLERASEVDGILIPSLEDHLRLLAIHAIKHGVFRPLWLCDLGLLLDMEIDWKAFRCGDRWLTDCATLALQLAGSLLGARIDGSPPRWAEEAVLKEWSDPYRWPHGHDRIGSVARHHPLALMREVRRRWPSALEATYNLRAPWSRMPRFPLQLAEVVVRKLPAIPRQISKGALR
jgi:hypothetical protein